MCLLLTNDSPSLDTLSHLRLLPLFIDYSEGTRIVTKKDEVNIHLGLQQHGRVRQVVLQAPSSRLCMWLKPMNKPFLRLEDLSLTSTTKEKNQKMSLVLPETLQAPDLRRLSLHGIGLPKELPMLTSMIALSMLSLTNIGISCYFPPGHLVIQLQGLHHLEELSIGFAIPIPLPSREGELLPALIPPVTLPTLRRLTFRGVGVYLDNLAAQINTPLLEQLNLTLFFEIVFSLVNLAEFIHRTEGFGCLVSRVIFNAAGPFIDTDGRVSEKLSLRINCQPLDWQVDSAAQVCSALWKVLSSVEELTVDLDVDGMPSDWKNALEDMLWHDLLLPFTGVKKLRIGSSLTFELSQALASAARGLVLGIPPELQELDVHLNIKHVKKKKAFSVFAKTRESVGRPVHLLTLPTIPRASRKVHIPNARPEVPIPNLLPEVPIPNLLPKVPSVPINTCLVVPIQDTYPKVQPPLPILQEPWMLWMSLMELELELESIYRLFGVSLADSAYRLISVPGPELTVRRAINDEEAPPEKEHRRHENKRRLRENPQRRANENWRHRQLRGASRINARISQPGGKVAF
jgi:hypothetical protein